MDCSFISFTFVYFFYVLIVARNMNESNYIHVSIVCGLTLVCMGIMASLLDFSSRNDILDSSVKNESIGQVKWLEKTDDTELVHAV